MNPQSVLLSETRGYASKWAATAVGITVFTVDSYNQWLSFLVCQRGGSL